MTRRTFSRLLAGATTIAARVRGQDAPARRSGAEPVFVLTFSAGGGLGPSFEVAIAGGRCAYHRGRGPGGPEARFDRELSAAQLRDLQDRARRLGLLKLASQDFKKQPLVSDQATFSVDLSLDGRSNTATCGMPDGDPKNDCQKRLAQLMAYLNTLLNVKMF